MAFPTSEEQRASLFAWYFLSVFMLQRDRASPDSIQATNGTVIEFIEIDSSEKNNLSAENLRWMIEIDDARTKSGECAAILPVHCDLAGSQLVLSIENEHSSDKASVRVEYDPNDLPQIFRVTRLLIETSAALEVEYRYSENSQLIVTENSSRDDVRMIFSSPLHDREYDELIQRRWKSTRRMFVAVVLVSGLLILGLLAIERW